MNILSEIQKDINALPLLADWLGSNEPMSQHTAEMRAAICVECPLNMSPNWWEKHVDEPIAQTIKSQLELKNRMEMKTSQDDSLHMCRVCGCCNRLKVWTPIRHIQEHMPAGQLENYPHTCWIPPEIATLNS